MSIVSSPGSVSSRHPAENRFGAYWARKNASDNKFSISIRLIGIDFVNMQSYIAFKAGQNRDGVRNLGQNSALGDLRTFLGQAVKIWTIPVKSRWLFTLGRWHCWDSAVFSVCGLSNSFTFTHQTYFAVANRRCSQCMMYVITCGGSFAYCALD